MLHGSGTARVYSDSHFAVDVVFFGGVRRSVLVPVQHVLLPVQDQNVSDTSPSHPSCETAP